MRLVTLVAVFLAALAATAQPAPDSLGAQLVAAVRAGDVAKAASLLDRWKTTGQPWPLGPDSQPLLFLAIEGREKSHPEMVELLLARGASVNARGPQGMTALHWAAERGYPERVDQILRHHPQLEATDEKGRTPLLLARSNKIDKLLAAGANVFAIDKDGLGALHYAARNGGRDLNAIWQAGLKVADARSNAGVTPLHIAAIEATESAASWLLDHGATVNAVTLADYNYLPRDFAPGYGYEIRLPRGATPLRLASSQHEKTKWSSGRYRAMVELLKARGGTGAALLPNETGLLVALSGAVLVPCAVAFFAGIIWLDARVTGWHRLAQKFPAPNEPPNVYRRQNGGAGTIGLVQVRGLMQAAADERGLYLAFPKFLRLGHRSLQIPWAQLRLQEEQKFLGQDVVHLQVSEPAIGRIHLRGGIAADVARRLRS